MEFCGSFKENNYSYKFVIYGRSKAGKTHLASRVNLYNDYSKFIDSKKNIRYTIGLDFTMFYIKYKNKKIKIQFYDTSGHHLYENIISEYFKGAEAVIFCYDANDRNSFNYIENKISQMKKINNKAICVLIRNKYDSKINEKNVNIISDEEGLEFADKNNLFFQHISCFEKNENGIINLFEFILDKILDKEENNDEKKENLN